ncbi:hypothetical protein [uncultured Nostoc sp.]|uniref:hypothetical protein n=1 Tax=uncultured Nostoc sp. TaxID=340711 RepID=UPI0035CAD728
MSIVASVVNPKIQLNLGDPSITWIHRAGYSRAVDGFDWEAIAIGLILHQVKVRCLRRAAPTHSKYKVESTA